MKIHYLIILPVLALILFLDTNCSKETVQKNQIIADTAKISNSLKGWELYSWQVGNERYYSLLYGTNRAKTIEEVQFITISTSVQVAMVNSTVDLEKILAKLATSENIFWYSCYSGSSAITLPSTSVVNEIKLFCSNKNLNLQLVLCD